MYWWVDGQEPCRIKKYKKAKFNTKDRKENLEFQYFGKVTTIKPFLPIQKYLSSVHTQDLLMKFQRGEKETDEDWRIKEEKNV